MNWSLYLSLINPRSPISLCIMESNTNVRCEGVEIGGHIYLISGATGWLGRATINHLLNNVGTPPKEIFALGSRERIERFGPHEIQIYTNQSIPKNLKVKIYFDFAFVTREYVNRLGVTKYAEANREIISRSEALLDEMRPGCVFLASSGAVYDSIEKKGSSTIYGALKLEQEERIRIKCKEIDSRLSICRIFNLSGAFITKSETFALANFLTSANESRQITVLAQNEVFRRYCNDEELIALILAMYQDNFAYEFDSGGYLVELRELAKIVKECVGNDVIINTAPINSNLEASTYFSKSQKYEELVKKYFGNLPKPLREQVEDTYQGIISKS